MKRANGTGTVVRLPGNRRRPYAVKVSVPDDRRECMTRQVYLGYFARASDAQAYLDQWVREGAHLPDHTLGSVWATYQDTRRYKALSVSAQSVHAMAWRYLQPLADRDITDIHRSDLQGIIDRAEAAGMAPASIAKIKILMGQLWDCAMRDDLVAKDPTPYVELPPVRPVRAKGIIPAPVVDDLWTRTSDPLVQDVLILICTGWRIGEYLSLTRDSYHTDPVPHLIGGSKTAAGRDRSVPVVPCIQGMVLSRLLAHRWKASTFAKHFHELMAGYDLPDASPHWTRYTFTSICQMAHVDPLVIDRVTGHANHTMTEHYTRLTLEYLYEQICRAFVTNAPESQE